MEGIRRKGRKRQGEKEKKRERDFVLDSASVILIRIEETKGKPRNMKLIKKKKHLVL